MSTSVLPPLPDNAWFRCLQPRPGARLRLICLPHAGGGLSLFHGWRKELLPDIELWAVLLPGRESRLHEPPISEMSRLIPALAANIPAGLLAHPYALFGTSLGGLIAFELARKLAREQRPQPAFLLPAATRPPHLPNPEPPILHLPDDAFLAALAGRYARIPPEVQAHAELLALLLPMLRADLALYETYTFRPDTPPLATPIIAVAGQQDELVDPQTLGLWAAHTTAGFTQQLLPAGHFFASEQPELLQPVLAQATNRWA